MNGRMTVTVVGMMMVLFLGMEALRLSVVFSKAAKQKKQTVSLSQNFRTQK